MKINLKFSISALLLGLFASVAEAQVGVTPGDRLEYLYRIQQLSDTNYNGPSFLIRPVATSDTTYGIAKFDPLNWAFVQPKTDGKTIPLGFSINPIDLKWFNSYNTSVPRGTNDGAIWQGVGYNTALSGGVYISNNWLHVRLNPIVGMSQNVSYDLGPYPDRGNHPYSFPLAAVDFVQRFGDGVYTWLDPGDSFAELRLWGMSLGFGTQRLWTGPAVFNPLMYSYNAAGFPRVYFGTHRPLNSRIGSFEFLYQYGAVEKSDYYNRGNSHKLASNYTLVLAYSPLFIKGLSVSFLRNYIENYPTDMSDRLSQMGKLFDFFLRENLVTEDNPDGWSPDDQNITISLRWVFPEHRFELYTEYGKDDHAGNIVDLVVQPDHASAYVFGFIKLFDLSRNRILSLGFETTQLESVRNSMVRYPPPADAGIRLGIVSAWNWHTAQSGFVHKGQIMGSGMGIGGNNAIIHADVFDRNYSYGFRFARMSHNNLLLNNPRYSQFILAYNEEGVQLHELRNVEFMLGLRYGRILPFFDLELEAALDQSLILNQHFIEGNDIWNTRFEVVFRKSFGGGQR